MGKRMNVKIPAGYSDKAWAVQVNYKYYQQTKDADGKIIKDPNATMSPKDWYKSFEKRVNLLKKADILKEAIWILHDKDTSGNHIHFALLFQNGETQADVIKHFTINNKDVAAQNVQPIDCWADYIRYLLHDTEDAKKDKKHQYDYKELKTTLTNKADHDAFIAKYKADEKKRNTPYNNKLDDLKIKKHEKEKKLQAIELSDAAELLSRDVLKGEITPETAIKKMYDAFPILASTPFLSTFQEANKTYLREVTKNMTDRKGFRNVYIAGPGDSGKSTTANAFVKPFVNDFGLHRVAAGSKDFAGNYYGQRATIYNETDPTGMKKEQLKDVFDPFQPPVVASRYFDKPWFPDICVHANSLKLGDFLAKALWHSGREYRLASADLQDFINVQVLNNDYETKDQMSQFIRRFNDHIEIYPTERKDANGNVVGGVMRYFKMRYIKDVALESWTSPYEMIQKAYRCVAEIDYTVYSDHEKLKKELDEKAEELRQVFDEYSEYTLAPLADTDMTGKLYGEYWKPAHNGTDMVEVFWEEMEEQFVWNLLPTGFLYDLFKEYSKRNNPSGSILSKPAFTERLGFVVDDAVWDNHMGRNHTQVKTGRLMDADEPLILEYDLYDWQNQAGRNDKTRLAFVRNTKYRGLKRL